ncbi:hypothetical protein ACSBR1_020206 [Camellia fascicularis]
MAKDGNQRNIVMFPFMAQGHLIPFLALARQLVQRKCYTITIVNTPLNIQKLKSLLPPETDIRLAEISFCGTDYDHPPDSENTDALLYTDLIGLFKASETLQSPFKSLIMEITEHDMHRCVSSLICSWDGQFKLLVSLESFIPCS